MKLHYTRPALADLDQILDYIAARSPVGADRVQARIKATLELLLRHPMIGTLTEEPGMRRMTASLYPDLIFYEPTETEIIIHAIRHSARNPSQMPGSG